MTLHASFIFNARRDGPARIHWMRDDPRQRMHV
jgi:hypothetical protein